MNLPQIDPPVKQNLYVQYKDGDFVEEHRYILFSTAEAIMDELNKQLAEKEKLIEKLKHPLKK